MRKRLAAGLLVVMLCAPLMLALADAVGDLLVAFQDSGEFGAEAVEAARQFMDDRSYGLMGYVSDTRSAMAVGYAYGYDAGRALQAEREADAAQRYVVNISTDRFHRPGCNSVPKILSEHRYDFSGERQLLIDLGFKPCANCAP